MTLAHFADLETPLDEAALFYVEAPDRDKHLSEIQRVVMFRQLVRMALPDTRLHACPNGAKRTLWAMNQARREGMVAGVFDLCAMWPQRRVAWLEFKGYDKSGRPGKLTQAQVDWGNSSLRQGHDVACFFTPEAAVAWLRGLRQDA